MRTIIILLLLSVAAPYNLLAKGRKVAKIVLDAGHGGKDIGAQGAVSREKDLTLAVTLKVGKIIADSMKTVGVVYTRTTDTYPSLVDRHEIANQSKADLFIAIHVNSTAHRKTRVISGYKTVKKKNGKKVKQPIYTTVIHRETSRNGVETYVLGLRRNSQKEDAIGEYGDNVSDEPGLLNPNDPQTEIIIAQYSQAFLAKSVSLGAKIQEQFAAQGRPDLGVKQMGLEVLAGSAMPGVLVEIGFINNIEEEAYLNSERGQQEVAMAIYKGIKAYKAEVEK
jgi:N-acetylmuramoyl-L-alanine amidase